LLNLVPAFADRQEFGAAEQSFPRMGRTHRRMWREAHSSAAPSPFKQGLMLPNLTTMSGDMKWMVRCARQPNTR
jgi:hypothetical protein